MTDEKKRPSPPAERGEQKARADDPHGTGAGGGTGQGRPKGAPTSDRQKTEGAADPSSGE